MKILNQLINDSNYWIRFELGLNPLKGKAYLEEMHKRATTIFNSMFDENDDILIVSRISNPIGSKVNEKPLMKRYIKNKKLIYRLKCETIPFEFDEDDSEMKTTQYSLIVKKHELRLNYLIHAIGNQDFGRKPTINGSIYLINLTNETLFHMYDDRGCDVFSFEKDRLLPLYYQFRSWILDYNRIQIDRKFELGLFNVYETSEAMNKRLELNENQVKETKINLYLDNTCTITHELEIPKGFAEECLSEVSKTGFEITYEQKSNNTIIMATKREALALIDYQSELMSLYAVKYKGTYNSWSAIKAF